MNGHDRSPEDRPPNPDGNLLDLVVSVIRLVNSVFGSERDIRVEERPVVLREGVVHETSKMSQLTKELVPAVSLVRGDLLLPSCRYFLIFDAEVRERSCKGYGRIYVDESLSLYIEHIDVPSVELKEGEVAQDASEYAIELANVIRIICHSIGLMIPLYLKRRTI